MVRTLGVVGEHFSVAHPSHGQVGFIPGVVKDKGRAMTKAEAANVTIQNAR